MGLCLIGRDGFDRDLQAPAKRVRDILCETPSSATA